MVAAGVYLVARVYPLMSGSALEVVAWVGAITAIFAACIAVAQNDIKRILAYSTVSQLGYMMLGLGVGGVAVGMFHLITHAFFQGAPVPRRGLGNSRLHRGPGHPQHGRVAALYAGDVCGVRLRDAGAVRVSAVCGVLEQGCDSARGTWVGRFRRGRFIWARWARC